MRVGCWEREGQGFELTRNFVPLLAPMQPVLDHLLVHFPHKTQGLAGNVANLVESFGGQDLCTFVVEVDSIFFKKPSTEGNTIFCGQL